MDPAARLRPWTPRLLFVAVVALLAALGFIQYQWFSRSAAVEIEGTIRGLEAGIRQTVTRELQRYAPLAAELADSAPRTAAETRAFVTRLWSTWGVGGTAPDLITSAGYSRAGDAAGHTLTSGGWSDGPAPVSGLGPQPESARTAQLLWTAEPAPGYKVTLMFFRPGETLWIGLDTDRFFNAYVRPVLAESYPGSTVTWDRGARQPPPPGGGFDTKAYAFNPFTALWAGPSVPTTLSVGVPRFLDGRSGRTGVPDLFPLPDLGGQGFLTVKLTLPADAPVLGVERRLGWNWLGGALLLVVLGAAFGLILRQSSRLAALRRREREFVASVSHELRTPLTVIRSAADNFAQGIVPAERQARYGELIFDQSLRLGRMIEEMLSFAQSEAAPTEPTLVPLVFETWLDELRPALETLAAARSVTLVWDVAGVPPQGVGDPEALRLILENLVVNAVNHAYSPASSAGGPRTVRITLRHLVPDRLELCVEDDGRGISAKEAKKVFEPFYRDQISRDTQEKGSGLGLFLAHRQATRLGGTLGLESPWRRLDGTRRPGCRFVLLVPFRAAAEEAPRGR